MQLSSFLEDFENMPKNVQRQLIEYAELLLAKSQRSRKSRKVRHDLTFSWENGLSEMKDHYSSVELQHQINELR